MSDYEKPVIIIDLRNKTLWVQQSVFKLLGSPKYIQFYINRSRTALGIKRCSQSADQAVKVPNNRNDYYKLYGNNIERLFCKVCVGWDGDSSYMVKGTVTSDRTLVCFNMLNAEIMNRNEVPAENENSIADTQNRS